MRSPCSVAKHGASAVAGQVPAAVRAQGFDALPEVVRPELREWGVEATSFRHPAGVATSMSWRERLALGGVVAVGIVLLVATVVGLRTMAVWTWARSVRSNAREVGDDRTPWRRRLQPAELSAGQRRMIGT